MNRLEPLPVNSVPGLGDVYRRMEASLGFIPNSLRIMAHKPEMTKAFNAMVGAMVGERTLEPEIAAMVGHMVSFASGCQYCQAHTHQTLSHAVSAEKAERIWEYERSSLFSDAERAAMRVAQAAGQVPNAVTDDDFTALKAYFSESDIVDIVAIIALYGFLNRWNDTFATELEAPPVEHARGALTGQGWTGGAHVA